MNFGLSWKSFSQGFTDIRLCSSQGRILHPYSGQRGASSWSDDYTCLFSCGMDSFSGILSASNSVRVTGAFTLHSDFPTLKARAGRLRRLALSDEGIQLKVIRAPRHSTMARKTRGVLYVLNAILLGNRNIIVPEIGPTMYQPPFTLLDEISVTTRPLILQCANRIAEQVTGQHISIIRPNENLTKAEVAISSPKSDLLRETCSCRSTMFANSAAPTAALVTLAS